MAGEALRHAVDGHVHGVEVLRQRTRRDPEADPPGWDDVYGVGTVAVVHKMIKVPDGTLRILVQGVQRVRLVGPAEEEPYLVGELEDLPDVEEALTNDLLPGEGL